MNPIIKNGNKLRWKFENVKDLTEKAVVSEKMTLESTVWSIEIVKNGENLDIYLNCERENKNPNWICEVHAKLKLMNQMGLENHMICKLDQCYYPKTKCWGFEFMKLTDLLTAGEGFLKEGTIMVEVDFSFKYYDWSKSIPSFTDITVNVKGTEFHLNKWVLSSKSEYFYDLFVNKKVEDTKIILEDVKVVQFCYMLASFFAGFSTDLEELYSSLIKLAKKLGVPSLTYKCEMFLIAYRKMTLIEKVQYADEHDLEDLMENCIGSLKSAENVRKLEADGKFCELTEATRLRIMNRLLSFI